MKDEDGVHEGGQGVARRKTGEQWFQQRPKEEEVLIRKNSTWLSALEDRGRMVWRVW